LHWEPKIKPVGSSEVEDRISNIVPKHLSIEQINKVILHFAKSAMRAKKAGFDGVQVHVAHGFLLNKFINPYYNRREDQYGGIQKVDQRSLLKLSKKSENFVEKSL
jgi:2,4-dienoyl-CoA reductase-like NADH-dependent reductase (Old Yellow Enzyme family)